MKYEIKTVPIEALNSGPYQVYSDIPVDRYNAIKTDIQSEGVRDLLHVDENMTILDGHHRYRICRELGIDLVEVKVYYGLTEDEKLGIAYKQGSQGKEVSREEKIQIAIKLRQEGRSYRQIADWLSIHPDTAREWILKFATVGDPTVTKVEGADGKLRPAIRKTAEELSEQETKALELREQGATFEEIGRELGVAPRTAKNYVDRAKKRREEEEKQREQLRKEQRIEEIGIEAQEREELAPQSIYTEGIASPNNSIIRARQSVFDAMTTMVSTYRLVGLADEEVRRNYLSQLESFVEAALILLDRYETDPDKSGMLSVCLEVFKKAIEPQI